MRKLRSASSASRTSLSSESRTKFAQSSWNLGPGIFIGEDMIGATSGAVDSAATSSPESPLRTVASPLRRLIRATPYVRASPILPPRRASQGDRLTQLSLGTSWAFPLAALRRPIFAKVNHPEVWNSEEELRKEERHLGKKPGLWYKLPEYDARQEDFSSPFCIHSVFAGLTSDRARPPTESQGVLGVSWGLFPVAWMECTSGSDPGLGISSSILFRESSTTCRPAHKAPSFCTGDGIGLRFTSLAR